MRNSWRRRGTAHVRWRGICDEGATNSTLRPSYDFQVQCRTRRIDLGEPGAFPGVT